MTRQAEGSLSPNNLIYTHNLPSRKFIDFIHLQDRFNEQTRISVILNQHLFKLQTIYLNIVSYVSRHLVLVALLTPMLLLLQPRIKADQGKNLALQFQALKFGICI